MNAEFHYHALAYLAASAGYPAEEARVIALSSQWVDRAVFEWELEDGGPSFRTIVTQDYVFWDEDTLRDIYIPFHFIPGDPELAAAQRRGPAPGPWVVTPDSPLARELLVTALREGDPFRIGIALHAYADTWAHQHFSGRLEAANVVDPGSALPPAGHLQALRAPDDAVGTWEDGRLLPEFARVVNRERFLKAARMIYRFLRTSRRGSFDDEELILAPLERLWAPGGQGTASRLADFAIELGVEPLDPRVWLREAGIAAPAMDEARASGYDKLLWLGTELRKRAGAGDGRRRASTGGRFEGSSLHRWDLAARRHRDEAQRLVRAAGLPLGTA